MNPEGERWATHSSSHSTPKIDAGSLRFIVLILYWFPIIIF